MHLNTGSLSASVLLQCLETLVSATRKCHICTAKSYRRAVLRIWSYISQFALQCVKKALLAVLLLSQSS